MYVAVGLLLLACNAVATSPHSNSSVSCYGNDYFDQLCVFNHLLMYRGELYFITEGAKPHIPEARMSEWFGFPWRPEEDSNSKPGLPQLSQYIKIVSNTELLQLLPDNPEVTKFEYAQLVHPLWHTLFAYWHSMDDAMSWYFRWCWHLGVCHYNEAVAAKSAMIWITRHGQMQRYRENADDPQVAMFQCYAKTLLRLRDTARQEQLEPLDDFPEDRVYIFEKMVAGTGNATAHVFHERELRQTAAVGAERMRAISFFRQCTGLTEVPAAGPSAQPRVVLMNRPYHVGRGIANIADIYHMLRHMQPNLNVTLMEMEMLAFSGQAHVFNAADVIMLPHGAAAMNLHFLPAVASVVHVNYWEEHALHQNALLDKLPAPPFSIANFPLMVREDEVEGITFKLRNEAQSQKEWTDGQKLDFMTGGFKEHNRGRSYNHLPDTEAAVRLMEQAIAKWEENYKQCHEGKCNGYTLQA